MVRKFAGTGIALWITLGIAVVALAAAEEGPASVTAAPAEKASNGDPETFDVLGEALVRLGASRGDLGYRPHASWARFPNPELVPYRLPLFDDVFAEPLRLYDLGRTMGNTVDGFLGPGALDSQPQALHKLLYFLAVDKRVGGFRDYSVNLPGGSLGDAASTPGGAVGASRGPAPTLLGSLEAAYTLAGQSLERRSFGKPSGDTERAAIERQINALPAPVQEAVARLVTGLVDAARWRNLALRNVPPEAIAACRGVRDLGATQGDALVYYPEIDDVARAIDEQSLAYAAMKTVQAAQDARTALRSWWSKASSKDHKAAAELAFAHRTPLGWVIVRGTRADVHTETDVLALVDLGGNDVYRGDSGVGGGIAPVAVSIDLAGNDKYVNEDAAQPAQGSGVFGAGILLDVEGDDEYAARTLAQGSGFFGVGVLVDESGADRYRMETSGQGCGYFGIGLCLDSQGDDDYAAHGEAQGFGGVGGGVGVLADHSGRDHYMAEPYASKVDRGDYHSQGKVNVSNAQGVGSGRRGDGADGHSWAGGLGAILDLHGNDTYESGNWSLGTGYWFGTGIAYDGAGNDLYRSVYFTQAAAAHYASGALLDEGGNDQHVLFETAGAALAFGWDYGVALLVDKAGDDRYEAKTLALGLAQIRSNALFFDLGGDDQYQMGAEQAGFGAADFREDYAKPDPLAPYNSETACFGIWIDAGGADRYVRWDDKNGRAVAATQADDRGWRDPAPSSPQFGYRNHGIGLDLPAGTLPELVRFDVAPPSPTTAR